MKTKFGTVLLVDDNESDNFLHERVIEKSGITDHVVIAMNGKEALDYLQAKHELNSSTNTEPSPELILLDINMPVMDGWEFLEAYQKIQEVQTGKTEIIILTTSLNPSDKTKADEILSPGRYYNKPLTLPMILDIMEKFYP